MIIDYDIYENYAHIYYDNGSYSTVHFRNDSGKVIWRYKFPNIKHTGIIFGDDAVSNQLIVFHTHPDCGSCVASYGEFAQGHDVFYQEGECVNDMHTTIQYFLDKVIEGEGYSAITNNCQMNANEACSNVRKSPDLGNWIGIGLLCLVGGGVAYASLRG